jgi:LmbE family N-acetylglucosaminyl deacetylase
VAAAVERDVPFDWGAAGLYQTLQRLQTTVSVLHVVAHPDDEDGPLLAYAARGLGARTMLFSITRGEGGANLISADFFDELGALRTLEHAKAASFYGNELFYSRATDYGYSKTLDEANRAWRDGRSVLADLVEVVRRERPTIVCSRFRGTPHDGHGHHQMAGVLSQQVFQAAADPQQFVEQLLRGLTTWQIRKLYANNIRPEWRPEDAENWTVALPTGQYNPILGISYAQIARYGVGFQRSQGISGHLGEAGPRPAYYRLLATADGVPAADRETSLLDGLDGSIPALADQVSGASATLRSLLITLADDAKVSLERFDPVHPDRVLDPLLDGLQVTDQLLAQLQQESLSAADTMFLRQTVQRKRDDLCRAIDQALGAELEVWVTLDSDRNTSGTAELQHATPGQMLRTHVRFVHQAPRPVAIRGLTTLTPPGWQVETPANLPISCGGNEVRQWQLLTQLDDRVQPTRQMWRRDSIAEPFYTTDNDYQQRPQPQPPLRVALNIQVAGVDVTLQRVAEVRFGHPQYGEVRYPLTVVPPVSVRLATRRGILATNRTTYPLDVIVRSDQTTGSAGTVLLQIPNGWKSQPTEIPFSLSKEGEERVYRFELTPAGVAVDASEVSTVRAIVRHQGREYSEGFQTVSARDVGRLNLYRDAVHTLRRVDVRVNSSLRVAYVMGSGDDVPAALTMLGLQSTMLSQQDLQQADLSSWDVILVGVRAYAVREDIRKFNGRLLDYVHAGGVLIVQYQTPEFDQNFGPYPYQMGRNPEEVSEEDAAVTLLEPEHPVFTHPNSITAADFDGWIEQRGSKFWTSWDPRYVPLLECHDHDQPPQRGGLLVTQYGRGYYVYAAFAWYRQLPEAVPGAYQIFANLISLADRVQ